MPILPKRVLWLKCAPKMPFPHFASKKNCACVDPLSGLPHARQDGFRASGSPPREGIGENSHEDQPQCASGDVRQSSRSSSIGHLS